MVLSLCTIPFEIGRGLSPAVGQFYVMTSKVDVMTKKLDGDLYFTKSFHSKLVFMTYPIVNYEF